MRAIRVSDSSSSSLVERKLWQALHSHGSKPDTDALLDVDWSQSELEVWGANVVRQRFASCFEGLMMHMLLQCDL